ncbi:MAG: exodeoxyribonuclease VII large subunit [bacterium]
MKALTVSELGLLIRECLKTTLLDEIWVTAEVHSITHHPSGHCYLELIEKEKNKESIVAKQRATIWSYTFRELHQNFIATTGSPLKVGMNILVAVSVEYHPLFGMSLNVKNIDPNYTLGALQQRRNEIINSLKQRGIIDRNKGLQISSLVKRIAIISSESAAGYTDFIEQLHRNQYGFTYSTTLFAATMQGEQTENSVCAALNLIKQQLDKFDIVVIIRGGGASSDLQAFDSEIIAEECALFPLPIISGIGHARDLSILDLVAYKSVKTPTAAAEFILSLSVENLQLLNSLSERMEGSVMRQLQNSRLQFASLMQRMPQSVLINIHNHAREIYKFESKIKNSTQITLEKNRNNIELFDRTFKIYCTAILKRNRRLLELLNTKIDLLNPQNILKKGYSYTLVNNQTATSIKDINVNDEITTILADGKIISRVTKKTK